MPGFSMGQPIKHKLGMRASGTAELVFDNVEVPEDRLIGEEGKAVLCMVSLSESSHVDAQSGDRTSDTGCAECRRSRRNG